MLLQPQALAQHLLHRLAGGVVAGHRLEFGTRRAQPGFQRIGRVEQATDRLPAASTAHPDQHGRDQCRGPHQQQQDGKLHGRSLAQPAGSGKFVRTLKHLATPGASHGLTADRPTSNIFRLMSVEVPAVLDAWRMVAARRGFEGRLPLASMERLRGSLVDAEGEVRFSLEFDHDALKVPYVELRIDAGLPLECQRSLQRFVYPVQLVQRLGLIRDEADEAALPEGYEPLLVPEDGLLHPAELVEDELILALPTVPVMPGSEAVEREWSADEEEVRRANPFSALAGLKRDP